jgi:hypothetical protein
MITVREEISRLTTGEPQTFRGLTLYPLFQPQAVYPEAPGYVLLDEAIAAGTARVTELTAGGSVPELRFENLGNLPVLLLDGQELVGAKQNRVLNLTIVGEASARNSSLPTSCTPAAAQRGSTR